MPRVPLGMGFYRRDYAGGVEFPLRNLFFEQDPTSAIDETAMIVRPGTDFYRAFGSGQARGLFTQEGLFGGDLFVVNGTGIVRWDGTTLTPITGTLSDKASPVSMTYQASPGIERLWIADGDNLWYYEGEGKARGNLNATGQPSNGDVVRIGSVYYEFVSANVDDNSPAGTSTNPWRVLIGLETSGSLQNLADAIGASGTPGGSYSSALVAHPNVEVRRTQPERLSVHARVAGAAGNSIVTTETGSQLSWGSGTLTTGGTHFLTAVSVPEGASPAEAPISVTTLAGYVIISVAGRQRMYLIRPGEFWVEAFVSAESEPDEVLEVIAVGGEFWAMGRSTIEPFTPTGELDIPFAPVQGRQRKYGYLPGTALVLESDIIFCDEKGIVRSTSGSRLSTHAIEEQIRLRG